MYLLIKRFFDVVLSAIVLLLLLPIFIPLIFLLKLTGEGEVFYFQERIGKNKESFYVWKFATMLKDSLSMGSKTVTLKGDLRITPIGHFLRKSKINELPQVINVLIGNMSIVGYRPLIPPSFKKYTEEVQNIISKRKPGVTGIGSIIFRNESEVVEIGSQKENIHPLEFYRKYVYPYKGAVEVWYQANISFVTDILIILLTAWQIVFPHSNLLYKVFKTLPKRPKELRVHYWKNY